MMQHCGSERNSEQLADITADLVKAQGVYKRWRDVKDEVGRGKRRRIRRDCTARLSQLHMPPINDTKQDYFSLYVCPLYVTTYITYLTPFTS